MITALIVSIFIIAFNNCAKEPCPATENINIENVVQEVSSNHKITSKVKVYRNRDCIHEGYTILTSPDTNVVFQTIKVCNKEVEQGEAELVFPCDRIDPEREIIIRMSNGILFVIAGLFSKEGKPVQFEVLQSDEQYVTTDHCYFKVDKDGELYDEHF